MVGNMNPCMTISPLMEFPISPPSLTLLNTMATPNDTIDK